MWCSLQDARNRGDADMLEVPHASLTLGREIGKGAFGRVFIARATNICGRIGTQMVAVKQLKSEYDGIVFVCGIIRVLRVLSISMQVLNQL